MVNLLEIQRFLMVFLCSHGTETIKIKLKPIKTINKEFLMAMKNFLATYMYRRGPVRGGLNNP